MKMKKLMSAALAGVMALSMGATALASGTTVTDLTEGAELEVLSVTKGATIKVLVPNNIVIGLNPYGMNVKLENGKLVDDTAAGLQVISPTYKIENQSSLPLKIGVKATGTLNGEGMEFVAAKPSGGDKKSAFVQLEYGPSVVGSGTITGTAKKLPLSTTETAGTDVDVEAYVKDSTTAKSDYVFTFSGNLNNKSTTAWTDDDTIGATLAFTFAIKV